VAEDKASVARRYTTKSAALRDMVQNHILQLFAFTAMESPIYGHAESLRDEKVKVMRSIRVPTPENPAGRARANTKVIRTNPRLTQNQRRKLTRHSLFVDNWRWAGYRLHPHRQGIFRSAAAKFIITFKKLPSILFGLPGVYPSPTPKTAFISVCSPTKHSTCALNVKKPGSFHLEPVEMDFAYQSKFGSYTPEAYETAAL